MFPTAAGKLSKNLGYGIPIRSILSSISLVVCLLFYLYVVGSFFEITVYPLIDRVTFYVFFQQHIVNEYIDNIIVIAAASSWFLVSVNNRTTRYSLVIAYGGIGTVLAVISPENIIFDMIALLSLPLIIAISLYYHHFKRQKNILNLNSKLTLRYISLAIIAISVMAIVVSLLVFVVTPDFRSIARDSYAYQLFLLLSSFSPIYIILLVFCLSVKVLFREVSRILKLGIKEEYITQAVSATNRDNGDNNSNTRLKRQTKIGIIVLAMILSVILVLIPQHPSINIDNQDIGVDTHYYVTWIGELATSESVADFAYQAFVVQGQDGDRPLSLIFLFLVHQVAGGNLSDVIEYSPIIFGPGIVLAFYFLTLELARNDRIALIAAFLGAVSVHTLAGIYAGFYANWLALIVGYISIAFLFRYLRSGRLFDIVVFSTLLIGVLFLHVYTWTAIAAVAGTFLLVMSLLAVIRKKKNSDSDSNTNNIHFTTRRMNWLLFAIFVSIVVDITKVVLTGSSGGIAQDIELAQASLAIEQFNLRWEILNATMHDSLGGVFSNFIVLILGLVWVVKSNLRDPSTVFLMIFLSLGLVPLFFGDWHIQARVFYNMPFELPAAIALYYISIRLGSILPTLAACTWLVAVALFTVMNYYLILVPAIQ